MNGLWLFLCWLGKVYATENIRAFEKFCSASIKVYAIWFASNLLYLFLPQVIPLARPLVYATILSFLIGLLINRFLFLGIIEWVKRNVNLKRKIIILGNNNVSKKLISYLEKYSLGVRIMGFIDDKETTSISPRYPLYNGIEETLRISSQLGVNEIYSTLMPENNPKVYKLMKQADKKLIRFKIVPDFSYFIDQPVVVDYLNDLPILTLRREPLEEETNRVIKRTFDIVVSVFATIFILSWLIPIISILLKLESKGPVFFVQMRSGKNNKPFRCFKFRSMRENKEANAIQATKNDKRVTRIGRILRETSLDEFPQFYNVLLGDMSVVGPRPHMLKHTDEFSKVNEDYMIRQYLKPGITGWAQVNGCRGEITELVHIKKRVEYDLEYLENWNLWFDVRIIFLTMYNVFKGEENAY
jgi:putative colanic acid biosynthesis UDP-glucose lipid carrier transferase